MKKEKLFKIGIINESTIDVVKDMTTFYTSDTELWLGFELSEESVEFDSAEILMFNIDNKSFVVRSVVKIDNKYWYELDMDIIAHHGEWKAQLQFTKNSEVYTSKHFNFRIENDLSDERPPKLVDITNWSNIKQTADSLISEMKVAVTEAIAAEQNREEIFAQAEQSRQTTFESNETARQTQELEREKAEDTRQSVFDENEATRDETFSAKEVLRQENETTRQQAETQRATAESIRASAEAQRKIDHANRSAELDGKANKKQEDWITPTLLNGWTDYTGSEIQYMKDEFGVVRFRGRLNPATKTDIHFMDMPASYRPAQMTYFNFGGDQFMHFGRTGVCQSYFTKWQSLEGVSYSTI